MTSFWIQGHEDGTEAALPCLDGWPAGD